MFLNKKYLFLLLFALFSLQLKGMEQRDLIMILDDFMGLSDQPERQDIDWTLELLVENLITKAAPMIVSNYTWSNFVQSRFNFNQKKDIPESIENIIYNQLYLPTIEELNKIAKQSGYDPKIIADSINNNEKWHSACSDVIDKLIKPALNKSILEKEFACFSTPFNPAEWDIYTYKHALYIFIPHAYAHHISKEYTKKFLSTLTFKDHKTGKAIDKQTAFLGIKTNNLTKLTISDIYNLPYKKPQIQLLPDQGLPLQEILITNKDVVKSKKTAIIHPFLWNVYIMGHGTYYIRPDIQQELDKWLHDIQKQKQAIERLTGISSFKYIDHENLIAQLKLRLQQADTNKEAFEEALTYAENLKDDYTWAYNVIFNNSNIMIAGIPALALTKLLQFFNTDVDTFFLFYDTCFAGLRNLLFPYLSVFGEPMKYNYTIATGTVTDKITINTFTSLLNQPSCSFSSENIFIENKKISLIVNRLKNFSFKEFFEALILNKPLAQTLKYVHTEIPANKEEAVAEYKPVIRLPGSTQFYVHDIDAKIQKISRVIVSIANMQGKLTIDGEKKPGLVLNTYFIPVPIHFINALPISIVSSIYEPTLQDPRTEPIINGYYFKEITMPTLYASLNNLTYLLLQGAMQKESQGRQRLDNPIPKLFMCDTVIDPEEEKPYEKVLIFNNIFLPLSLTKGEASDDADTFSTGFMYTQNNKPMMKIWETTENFVSGVRTTEYIERQLTEPKEIEDYNDFYDRNKNTLIQKANSEGLSIIPLEIVAKTLQSRATKKIQEKK